MKITKQNLQNSIPSAISWAVSIWKESSSNWAYRSGQDLNYRNYVVNPFIESQVESFLGGRQAEIIELGCGDGILLESKKMRSLIGEKGSYTGIDASDILLKRASEHHSRANISFINSDLSGKSLYKKISQKLAQSNIVISVFVIQEIPDIKGFMENLSSLINQYSSGILITVHPDFAKWLRNMKRIPVNIDLQSENYDNEKQWRWAGSYPIVDEFHNNFYLPYFHRELEDYIELFENAGLIVDKLVELPDSREIQKLTEKRISPFVNFKNNDYWPMIAQKPSAEAFIIRKRNILV